MNNDDIIRMALAAGLEQDGDNFFSRNYEEMDVHIDDLKRFAEIVAKARDAEHAEKLKYDIHSCGPTCERYICVAIRNAVSEEREACAKDTARQCAEIADKAEPYKATDLIKKHFGVEE